VLMPTRADALLLGVLCAYLLRQERYALFLHAHVRLLYVVALIFVGLALFGQHLWSPQGPSMALWGYSVIAFLYACLLLIAVTETRGPVTLIVRSQVLRQVGVLAYGLYVFHQGVSGVLHAVMRHQAPQITSGADVLVTLGALVATFALASLSWEWFEK